MKFWLRAAASALMCTTSGFVHADNLYKGAPRTFLFNPAQEVCFHKTDKYKKDGPYTIGFSNAGLVDSWRVVAQHVMEKASFEHKDKIAHLLITDAGHDDSKQVADIQDLISRGVDLLIVSANSEQAVDPAVIRSDQLRHLPGPWGPGISLEGLMLTITNLSKSFPGVRALSDVQLDVRAGEIHALLGENGAGKSTLTKIVAGVYRPDDGLMEFDGAPVHWNSAGEAKDAGIHVIYQEFVLFPQLTVAENIFLGNERRKRFGRVDHRQTRKDAVDILRRLGVFIDPDSRVSELSVADQQMVEIAKALVHKVKLLILDEPTAVIAGKEVSLLFQRISALKAEGVAVIYISHRLEEIFEICDRVTILKDGKFVACREVSDLDRDQIVSLMVGRDMAELFPAKATQTEPLAD
ncbi:MAG TPA: ATP-binding cassette domain-containing protein [Rhizobium sp.]